ncbi:MAG: hypothetical protein QGG01_04135, partial [Roseibacillus sp.]|nr:hypothetical protein [Roseibacillus sp.]
MTLLGAEAQEPSPRPGQGEDGIKGGSGQIVIDDGAGSAARTGAPIRIGIRLQRRQLKLAR